MKLLPTLRRGLRKLANKFLHMPAVKRLLLDLPVTGRWYPGIERRHPFDAAQGTDTSGFLDAQSIAAGAGMAALIHPYAASQPSIVGRVLALLGDVERYAFMDIGCGKGRATLVASQFPFRAIVGVELSPDLAAIARANAAIVARTFPHRRRIDILQVNVLDLTLPEGDLVLFLYHPFGPEILSALIRKLEVRFLSSAADLVLIYYNPVHGDVIDASPVFSRWYAECLPCAPAELDYGFDPSDAVVIWKRVGSGAGTPHARASRSIVVIKPLRKVGLSE